MVMLDFICTGAAEMFGTEGSEKSKNENICLQRDSNPRHAITRQVNQCFRPLGTRWLDIKWSIHSLTVS